MRAKAHATPSCAIRTRTHRGWGPRANTGSPNTPTQLGDTHPPNENRRFFGLRKSWCSRRFPQVTGCSEVGIQQQVRCVSVPSNLARKPPSRCVQLAAQPQVVFGGSGLVSRHGSHLAVGVGSVRGEVFVGDVGDCVSSGAAGLPGCSFLVVGFEKSGHYVEAAAVTFVAVPVQGYVFLFTGHRRLRFAERWAAGRGRPGAGP